MRRFSKKRRLLELLRRREMRAAWERDGGRCLRCGRPTSAPGHHPIKGADRHRGVPWWLREFVLTLCGPRENDCHGWAEEISRAAAIEFIRSINYNGKFDRLIAVMEAWYPMEVER